MIRVVLPAHLKLLAHVEHEVELSTEAPITLCTVLDTLEVCYPVLRGTIRDQVTHKRRPFIRFFACGQDLSHAPANTPLPDAILQGDEPLLIVGAMAGG